MEQEGTEGNRREYEKMREQEDTLGNNNDQEGT